MENIHNIVSNCFQRANLNESNYVHNVIELNDRLKILIIVHRDNAGLFFIVEFEPLPNGDLEYTVVHNTMFRGRTLTTFMEGLNGRRISF